MFKLPLGKGRRETSKKFVRVGFFLQNGFFADFYFGAAGLSRGFCRRMFLLNFFVGRSAQRNPPGKAVAKSSAKFIEIIIPDDFFLQRGSVSLLVLCFEEGKVLRSSFGTCPSRGLAMRPPKCLPCKASLSGLISAKIGQKAAKIRPYPKNLLRLFFRNSLTRLKITSEVKNNLKRPFSTLF